MLLYWVFTKTEILDEIYQSNFPNKYKLKIEFCVLFKAVFLNRWVASTYFRVAKFCVSQYQYEHE